MYLICAVFVVVDMCRYIFSTNDVNLSYLYKGFFLLLNKIYVNTIKLLFLFDLLSFKHKTNTNKNGCVAKPIHNTT